MKTKPTTLRDILDQMAYNLEWIFPDIKGSPRIDREKQNKIKTEAEQAIKSLMLSKLPEKKYVSEDEDPAKAYDDLVHQGYNQALDQWEQAILELMK